MSLLSDAIRSRQTTVCAVCGDTIARHDALMMDGQAFCSVLHQVEYLTTRID